MASRCRSQHQKVLYVDVPQISVTRPAPRGGFGNAGLPRLCRDVEFLFLGQELLTNFFRGQFFPVEFYGAVLGDSVLHGEYLPKCFRRFCGERLEPLLHVSFHALPCSGQPLRGHTKTIPNSSGKRKSSKLFHERPPRKRGMKDGIEHRDGRKARLRENVFVAALAYERNGSEAQ